MKDEAQTRCHNAGSLYLPKLHAGKQAGSRAFVLNFTSEVFSILLKTCNHSTSLKCGRSAVVT